MRNHACIAVVASVFLLAACGGGSESPVREAAGSTPRLSETPAPTRSVIPSRIELITFAQAEFDAFAKRDYGTYWDGWSKSSKDRLSRDDFISYAKKCNLGGALLEAGNAEVDDEGNGVVQAKIGEMGRATTFKAEGGQWRYVPAAASFSSAESGTC